MVCIEYAQREANKIK